MWTKSGIECKYQYLDSLLPELFIIIDRPDIINNNNIAEGQYAVTQEISEIFKTAICNKSWAKIYHLDQGHKEPVNFRDILESKIKTVLKQMGELNIQEVDAWLGFLPGCDYMGLRAGQWVLTQPPSNQRVMIIGFSNNYIKDAQVDNAKKPDIEKIGMTMKF